MGAVSPSILRLVPTPDALSIAWSNGAVGEMPALWLRVAATRFSDGSLSAERLRVESPAGFELLATTDVALVGAGE